MKNDAVNLRQIDLFAEFDAGLGRERGNGCAKPIGRRTGYAPARTSRQATASAAGGSAERDPQPAAQSIRQCELEPAPDRNDGET